MSGEGDKVTDSLNTEEDKVSKLIDSVKENNVKVVESLLKEGVNPSSTDEDGVTLLMVAAELGFNEIVQLLLSHGADVDAIWPELHGTALMFSAMMQELHAVRLLLDGGADVNIADVRGDTVLMHAILNEHEQVVKMLLHHEKCSLEMKNNIGHTALHMAVQTSNVTILDALLKAGAAPNSRGHKGDIALMHATEARIAKLLLAVGCDPNHRDIDGRPCLDHAIMNQVPQVASVLIKAGADVNAKYMSGMTPLFRALLHWVPDIVEKLVEHGAQVTYLNEKNRGAIYHAAAVPDAFICQFLLDKGADPDTLATDGSTPIYLAVSRHNSPVAKLLLKNNVKLDRVYPHFNAVANRLLPHSRVTLLDVALQEELSDLAAILFDLGCPVVNSYSDSASYSSEIQDVVKNITQPRSLLNIVRNSVRKSLGLRLLQGVPLLGLPSTLSDFILLLDVLRS